MLAALTAAAVDRIKNGPGWLIGSYVIFFSSSSFLGSTAQFRPWPPPQNPSEFLGGFSTILFFTG
jgi:hypothetical protein